MAKNHRKTRTNRKANRKTRKSCRKTRRNMRGGFQGEAMQAYKSPFVTNLVRY